MPILPSHTQSATRPSVSRREPLWVLPFLQGFWAPGQVAHFVLGLEACLAELARLLGEGQCGRCFDAAPFCLQPLDGAPDLEEQMSASQRQ